MSLLMLLERPFRGADLDFNGPMLGIPYSLSRLGFTYTRNSPKTVYQNNALVTLAANQFGTTYDAVTGLHAFEAEPAATNLATNSAGAAATWTVSNVADAATPITGFAASLAFGDNSVVRTASKTVSVTNTVTYSVSIFIEMDDGNAPVLGASTTTGDLAIVISAGGVLQAPLVTRIGTSSLYRVSASRAATATVAATISIAKYTTQSARTFRVVGIQVETGSRATSYIATAGATVTRAADVLSCAVANIPGFSAAGYTLFGDARQDVVTGLTSYVCAINKDGNDRAAIYTASSAARTIAISGGVTGVNQVGANPATSRFKFAFSATANLFSAALNGAALTQDTSGNMPVGPVNFEIGGIAGSGNFNGYIYRARLIPTALNQAQTTGLTV